MSCCKFCYIVWRGITVPYLSSLLIPQVINRWQVGTIRRPDKSPYIACLYGVTAYPGNVRPGDVLLHDEVVLLHKWDGMWDEDVIAVSQPIQSTVDNNQRGLKSVWDATPHHNRSSSKSVIFPYTCVGVSLTISPIYPNASIVMVEKTLTRLWRVGLLLTEPHPVSWLSGTGIHLPV